MEQKLITVKFPNLQKTVDFFVNLNVNKGDFVVSETSIGLELGQVVDVKTKFKLNGKKLPINLREATKDEVKKSVENKKKALGFLSKTKEIVKNLKLNMKVFDAELTLDEKKLIVYYVAENRVDFRELVKVMASQFKKRIELHQVNQREQLQRCGSIGMCGKTVCCHKFLEDFKYVSIKMAKTQGLSLIPTNTTGACGKLLCCLAYENDEYLRLTKEMPAINSIIKTPDGEGKVLFNNLIKKTSQVKVGDDIKTYTLEELKPLNKDENDKK